MLFKTYFKEFFFKFLVSIRRIRKFLLLEEVDPTQICHLNDQGWQQKKLIKIFQNFIESFILKKMQSKSRMPRFHGTQIAQTICNKRIFEAKLFKYFINFQNIKRVEEKNKKLKRKKSKPNDQEEEIKLNEFKVTTHLNK